MKTFLSNFAAALFIQTVIGAINLYFHWFSATIGSEIFVCVTVATLVALFQTYVLKRGSSTEPMVKYGA